MSIPLAVIIVVGTTAVSVVLMLLVRRRAPAGGHFRSVDRAASVFGILATAFAVLLGFVMFLTFTSYDAARHGAEDEALLVQAQLETVQLLPADVEQELTGELVCYARSVAGIQWQRMEDDTLGDDSNPWANEMFYTLRTIEPESNAEQSAYEAWLTQNGARIEARNDRIHGAEGVIPIPLWLVMFFGAGMIVLFMLFYVDRNEGSVVQGFLMASVVATITSLLCVLAIIDHPFHDGPGGLQPVAMQRVLKNLDHTLRDKVVVPPCDEDGVGAEGG
jgi:hypothetical protein